MPNLKEIKRRIGSVKKTKQITSAMKLVAGARLKKATDAATAAKPYKEKISETLSSVASQSQDGGAHALLAHRDSVKRVLMVILSSDRGLCGPFNNGLLRQFTKEHAARTDGSDITIDISIYGRKGRDFLRARKYDIVNEQIDYGKTEKMELVRPLCDQAVSAFSDGSYDEVWICYNEFKNTITQIPTFSKILPISIEEDDSTRSGTGAEHRYEPDADSVLGTLLPLYLRTQVLQAFLETEAGEFAARMTAMDNATRNASDLISALTLQYNRARQAAITKEIIEIVSGAEAL
jgi:F-type H+-transporting ATPase subunit gamma